MWDLLKTLWRPDREENPADTIVARAANILQVGEFQLLQLAYFDWFAEELPKDSLDDVFRIYMIRGEIPAWARHYARQVLLMEESGGLDESDPTYHRYDADYVTNVPQGLRRFLMVSFCLVAIMTSALAIGSLAKNTTNLDFPPYFNEEELPAAPKGPGAS